MKTTYIFLALLATTIPAKAIEGRYRVEGSNPGQTQVYKGEAIIKKTGETYSVVWQIGPGRQIGTGILSGAVLSVVFQAVGGDGGGVASFEIIGNSVTTGRWTPIGGHAVGTERWSLEGQL